ncbi:Uncharacterised protein [Mycobacteroides abscessus subsp. abscessus]|nr:Uncharacterised protein [Mycobacteroides abscessus subsp. abscessus]
MRWYTSRCATRLATSGTIWMADAPVPITATRLPESSTSSSQRAECMTVPPNDSIPSMSGRLGSQSGPTAPMRCCAQYVVTAAVAGSVPAGTVSISQRCCDSLHAARVTSTPNLALSRTPKRSATSLM